MWTASNLTSRFVLICSLTTRPLTGVASDPLHPPGESECTDGWLTCFWHTLTNETTTDDLHIDGLADDCLLKTKGSFIYQRHDDVASPGLDSLLLYRPTDEHLWVVAPGRLAFESCFASTAAYLHTIRDVCARRPDARRPDGGACKVKWRHAAPDGTWRDTNATAVAVDECEDGENTVDMCCGVKCASGGLPCGTEFRAGAWSGVCPNGTAHNDSTTSGGL